MKHIIPLIVIAPFLTTAGFADSLSNTNSQDKSRYNLFNPTPSDLLRPMNSDKYDGVWDAHTVDAGHVEVDTSVIDYYELSFTRNLGFVSYRYSSEEYSWDPRFRIGLLNNMDFEVNPSYSIRSFTYKGAFNDLLPPPYSTLNYSSRTSGFGNVGLGPTINLWGNDGGPTALAIHTDISIPTDGGHVVGGGALAFGWQLPKGFYLKIDSAISADEESGADYMDFDNSISLHKAICSKWDVYCYLNTTTLSEPEEYWYAYTGVGAIYQVTRNFQVFGGMGFGFESPSFDYNPRFGIVFRY